MRKLAGILAAAVCFTFGAVQVLAAPFTQTQALTLAQKAVPADSAHLYTESDGAWFEVKFLNDKQQERYEVNVQKSTGKITSFESEAIDARGGTAVTLTEAQAKKILLDEHKDAKVLTCVTERDDGRDEYRLTFSHADYYGEYSIHPQSGKVLEREIRVGAAPDKTAADGFLTVEKAIELAQKQAPGAVVTDIDLERDDGRYCYKIELAKDGAEYDVTLDAKTGELLWNRSTPARADSVQDSTAYLAKEQAKQIVLAKIPSGRIVQWELDRDDGRAVYEGEAVDGTYEYEFTLDAKTGEILEWDRDRGGYDYDDDDYDD